MRIGFFPEELGWEGSLAVGAIAASPPLGKHSYFAEGIALATRILELVQPSELVLEGRRSVTHSTDGLLTHSAATSQLAVQ